MDSHLSKTRDAITSAIRGMSLQELLEHPPEKWSSAQILEHLALAYSGTSRGLEKVLLSGQSAASAKSWKLNLQTIVVNKVGYLPKGRKSPAGVVPRGSLAADTVLTAIVQNLEHLDDVLTKCEQKFGAKRKLIDHPVLGAFSVSDWRKFHYVHTRHHMKQIRSLRDNPVGSARQ